MKLISLTAWLQSLMRFFIEIQPFPDNAICVSPNHVISSFWIRLCLEFDRLHLRFAYNAHLGFSLLHIFHIWDLHISQNLGIAFIACLLTFIQPLVVLIVVTVMMVILFEVMMAITRCQLRIWLSWVGCNTILQQNIIYIILGGMPQQELSTILLQFNLGD